MREVNLSSEILVSTEFGSCFGKEFVFQINWISSCLFSAKSFVFCREILSSKLTGLKERGSTEVSPSNWFFRLFN